MLNSNCLSFNFSGDKGNHGLAQMVSNIKTKNKVCNM